MIAKVVRGWHPAGLVAYLFGPGRHEEHRNPRVVAAWDGAPWLHQPERLHSVALDGEVLAAGEFDLDLRQLIRTMRGPLKAAGLPANGLPEVPAAWAAQLRAGGRLPSTAPAWLRHYVHEPRTDAVVARPGPVWHCSVRLHPGDPTLSDEQWEHIAERLMRATGIQEAGCRWIAVRHADDHIHLMATLVSQDSGERVHPYRDFPKLRAECQRLERELGLTRTASADQTAAPAPTRAELEVARRLGRERTLREDLRLVVAQCAATSSTSSQFLTRLTKEDLDPRVVRDAAGQICGYTVTPFGYRTRSGDVLRFAGRSLAPDLSWAKLQARWATLPEIPLPQAGDRRLTGPEVAAGLSGVAATVQRATGALRDGAGRDLDSVAYAAGEVLAALSHGREGTHVGPVTAVAQRYDRAARTPHRVLPGSTTGVVAAKLRHAARQLGALGVLTGRFHERFAMTALLLALASLVAEIAAWQQLLNRPHQAAAATSAAQQLPALASAAASPTGTAGLARAAGVAPAAPPALAAAMPSRLSQPVPDWARPARTGMPASNPASRGRHR